MFNQKKNGYDDDDEYRQDVPTEAAIESEEDKLKELQSSQKNLFLIIFQVKINCIMFVEDFGAKFLDIFKHLKMGIDIQIYSNKVAFMKNSFR